MGNQDWKDRVVCDPKVRHGEPTIRGTRIAVSTIVASLADFTAQELLVQYPQLSAEDIKAALHFAAAASHSTLVA